MKKTSLFIIGIGALTAMTACSGADKKVESFATDFARNVQAGNIDSLVTVYPDVELADSLSLTFVADSLKIEKSDKENEFIATFGNGKSAVIVVDADGNMTVAETYGIFAYPEEKMSVAEKSGALRKEMNDKELAGNMIYLDDMTSKLYARSRDDRNKAITMSGPTVTKDITYMMEEGRGYYTLKNNTDTDISGDEYDVTWMYSYCFQGIDDTSYSNEKGKDIPAGGTVRYDFTFTGHGGSALHKINIKAISESDFLKNYKFEGNEFDKYMETADKSLINKKPLGDGPYNISGKLGGKYPIHMTLDKGMKKGTYYYDKSGANNTLNLSVKSFNKRSGKIVIEETNNKGEVTGTFTGQITNDAFTGRMTSFQGRTYDFTLAVN